MQSKFWMKKHEDQISSYFGLQIGYPWSFQELETRSNLMSYCCITQLSQLDSAVLLLAMLGFLSGHFLAWPHDNGQTTSQNYCRQEMKIINISKQS